MIQETVDNLSENALDYLQLAGEMAKEDTPRSLKHAIATLADGIELLLKARLAVYDWSLIFEDVDKAKRDLLKSGDFKSVTYDQAVIRLENICLVTIESKNSRTIKNIRNLRNKIRHFSVTVKKEEATALLVETYSFAIDFTTQHLEEHLGSVSRQLVPLRRLLGEFQAFIDERMNNIKPILAGQSVHFNCPQCFLKTLFADSGEASCAFCGYKGTGVEAAEAWADRLYAGTSFKDRMIDPIVMPCPECGARAFIFNPFDLEHQCLSCGEHGEYTVCNSCGELYSGADNPGDRCDRCWQYMLDKND